MASWRSSKGFALSVVCLAQFIDMFVYGLIIPIVPIVATQKLDLSYLQISFLFASYASGLLIFTPITGLLSDRIGRRWPMIVGISGLGASTVLFAYCETFVGFLLARFAQGVSGAVSYTVGTALLADTFPASDLPQKLGIANGAMGLGVMLGPVAGGFMFERLGYKFPFYFAGGLALLDVLGRILLQNPPPPTAEDPESNEGSPILNKSNAISQRDLIRRILKDPKTLFINASVFLGGVCLTMVEPIYPLFLESRFGLGSGMIGLVFLAMSTSYAISAPLVGTAQTRISGTALCSLGFLLAGVFLPLTTLPRVLWPVFVLFAFVGVFVGLMLVPSLTDLSARVDALGAQGGSYGLVYSMWNISYSIGMFVGPVLSGSLTSSFGLFAAMTAIGALLGAFSVVFWIVMKRA